MGVVGDPGEASSSDKFYARVSPADGTGAEMDESQFATEFYENQYVNLLDFDEFKLTETDKNSAVWQKLKNYLSVELNNLRKQNDESLSEVATMFLRGKIERNKEILALGEDPEPVDLEEPSQY